MTYSALHKIFATMWITGALLLILVTGQLIVWIADTEPPFEMISAISTPATAGSYSVITAKVRRDLFRECSSTYGRIFYDNENIRHDIKPKVQQLNSLAIEDANKRMPDTLSFSVEIPSGASKGSGTLVTSLDYFCNPMHRFWPIPVIMTIPIEVL